MYLGSLHFLGKHIVSCICTIHAVPLSPGCLNSLVAAPPIYLLSAVCYAIPRYASFTPHVNRRDSLSFGDFYEEHQQNFNANFSLSKAIDLDHLNL